jgi:hypothetical protein
MVGLLYALPNTQLTRRLAAAGRLHPGHDLATRNLGDQCAASTNFDTLHPLGEVLRDYRCILERVYAAPAFADRLQKLAHMLDRSGRPRDLPEGDIRRNVTSIEMAHKIIAQLPEAREQFWQNFVTCAKQNPTALRYIMILTAFYLHLAPFARNVIAGIDAKLAELELATTANNRASASDGHHGRSLASQG